MHKKNTKTDTGFVTLLSVLIVGAIGTSIVISLLILGVGNSGNAIANGKSKQAMSLADACAEEALQQIHDSTSFSGGATMNLGAGNCTYTVTNTGGQNRSIASSGTVDTIVRKVVVIIDKINPEINVVSWAEVADF